MGTGSGGPSGVDPTIIGSTAGEVEEALIRERGRARARRQIGMGLAPLVVVAFGQLQAGAVIPIPLMVAGGGAFSAFGKSLPGLV
jgi:hypothetical protein